MKFTLSLRTGGLMEDPGWHYEHIKVVEADNLCEAKEKYAKMFGFYHTPLWNDKNQTYWGWDIDNTGEIHSTVVIPHEDIKF